MLQPFIPEERALSLQYPVEKRLSGPQTHSGRWEEQKKKLPLNADVNVLTEITRLT
jgi:hypothetical protein